MNAPLLPGRIEHWPLARLRPYARNAKTHNADQVAKIATSMAEFGWTVPCLVAADGELIAGHGRVLAAAQLGLAEAPVIVLGHLTEAQRRAYRIADNKLTELGGWDDALLLEELRGLMAEDFDLGLIGIPEDELDALLHDADDRAPINDDKADTIPEAPAEPITRPGDIWALGDHRLISGDATDPSVVARLMDGAQASLLFTSPPYEQQRDYGAAKEKVGDWDALMQGVFAAAPVTADAQLLVNLGLVHRDGEWIPYWEGWLDWMRAQGWRRFGWYVWDQGPGLPGAWNGRLAPSHEFIFHFNRQPRKPNKTVESNRDLAHAGRLFRGRMGDAAAAPSPPPAGKATVYARNRAGAPWIDVMRPSGRDFPLQPHFGVNRIANWSPSVSTTITTEGLPITSVGTVSHPTLAATNLAASMRRWRLTSAAVVDSVADQRSAGWACWRGNAAGLGGWTYVTRISLTTLQSTGMGFFGLYGSTAALATTLTLAAAINCIGIGFQRGTHTRWQLVANDGAGAPTLTDMGASFGIATGGVLTLFIAAPPNGSSVWVRVVDEVSGAVFEQEITADLPAATQFLSPRLFLNNGATAAAVAYDCAGVYLETDF